MFETEPGDWRELLGWITSDPMVLQRVVQDLGVRDITVKRWVKGESEPRPQNIRRLLNALPEHREQLLALFSEEFEDFSDLSLDETHQEIPAKFYKQIFQIRSTISSNQRFWEISNAVVNQALSQLDPDNLGIAITIVRCMVIIGRPTILSLRESIGMSTPPWPGNLEQKALFLGAESLAGHAVSTCHPAEVHNYQEEREAPVGHQFELEQSAVAYPILYAGRIAGCLLVSSTEPAHFLPSTRMSLLADYAHLISLAFAPEEFIDPSRIELRIMPFHPEQKKHFADYRNRLIRARVRLYEAKNFDIDAEQVVWEELEEELLQ